MALTPKERGTTKEVLTSGRVQQYTLYEARTPEANMVKKHRVLWQHQRLLVLSVKSRCNSPVLLFPTGGSHGQRDPPRAGSSQGLGFVHGYET